MAVVVVAQAYALPTTFVPSLVQLMVQLMIQFMVQLMVQYMISMHDILFIYVFGIRYAYIAMLTLGDYMRTSAVEAAVLG